MIPLALALAGGALVVAPRALARWTAIRTAPRAAIVLWQAMALAAVLCVLAAGPVALVELAQGDDAPWQLAVSAVTTVGSVAVLAHLLLNGHRIGRSLRAARRDHRELIDLAARHEDDLTRVLEHRSLRAYCVPGRSARVVLTDTTVASLAPAQLTAVLVHEHAHLRERHDLVLEFFTVLHTAAPAPLRARAALDEVRLLVEVLADRAAVRRSGAVVVAGALVTMASASHPDGALGAGTGTVATRIRLLDAAEPRWRVAALYLTAALVVAVPFVLVAAAVLT